MKKILAVVLCAMLVLSLAACGGTTSSTSTAASESSTDASSTESTADEETSGGKLLVGTSADYAPFEFIYLDDNGDQQYAGYDIGMCKVVAADMGLELEVVNMGFDNLMASLQKGEVDMVVAAIEKTEERAQVADFSDPYYTDLPAMILVKKENADKYSSIEDFAGKTVGAQSGTTKADIVNNDMTGATPLLLQTVPELVNNLVYDKCDAIVLDGAVATEYAETNEDLVILESVPLGDALPFCICVQKGDPKGLLDSANATIAKILEDGTMESIIAEADALVDKAVE